MFSIFPNCANPIPISCYLSSLSPFNSAHVCMGLGPSTLAGKPIYGHILNKDWFSFPKKLFTANISSVWYGAWRAMVYSPTSKFLSGFISCRSYVGNCCCYKLNDCSSHVTSRRQHFIPLLPVLQLLQSSYLLFHSVLWVLVVRGFTKISCLEQNTEPLILSTLIHCESPHWCLSTLKRSLPDSNVKVSACLCYI